MFIFIDIKKILKISWCGIFLHISHYNILVHRYRLRKIQASLTKKEIKNAELREKKETKKKEIKDKSLPALNAHKPPVKEPEFVDPAKLTGDLRSLEGNGKWPTIILYS